MKPTSEANRLIQQKLDECPASPVGSFQFVLRQSPLFEESRSGIIIQVTSLAQTFRLERLPDMTLHYYHWSPGLGSRLAVFNLRDCQSSHNTRIGMTWSPDGTELILADAESSQPNVYSAKGVACNRTFRLGRDSNVYQIGDIGLETMGVRFTAEKETILLPTALEFWHETKTAGEVLLKGKSEDGYLFDVALSNAILGGLVTGFETYCKYRFLELFGEGVTFDASAFAKVAVRKEDRPGFLAAANKRALHTYAVLHELIEAKRKVNFQDFSFARRVFKKAYGIDFSSSGFSHAELEDLAMRFKYRHRSVHVSPLVSIYSKDGEPGHPVMARRAFTEANIEIFNRFIEGLHAATIEAMRKMKKETDEVRKIT